MPLQRQRVVKQRQVVLRWAPAICSSCGHPHPLSACTTLDKSLRRTCQSPFLISISSEVNGFPGGSGVKKSACQCRRRKRPRFDPGSGRSPGEGNANPLQYSCLENPTDRGARQAPVHGVVKSQAGLNMHSCRSKVSITPARVCMTKAVLKCWCRHRACESACKVSKNCQILKVLCVTHSRESWTVKKAEHRRIDAFKWWC